MQELWLLHSVCCLMLIDIYMKFLEDSLNGFQVIQGMFEMNCLLSSSSISTWGTIKTNTYLYRAIQYLHNGV